MKDGEVVPVIQARNKNMKKEFDFKHLEGRTANKAKLDFLKEVYRTDISEEEFAERWAALPRVSNGSLHNKYSPSAGRQQYRKLKKDFNFFKE